MNRDFLRAAVATAGSLALAAPLAAQEAKADVPAGQSDEVSQGQQRAVYDAAYFTRFAPRSALEMLNRLPGFSIQNPNDRRRQNNETEQRGLGQANQNVLLNGKRLTSKSSTIADQLGRIPAANVLRIEILDGTALDTPGLTGPVANIVSSQTSSFAGQFEWNAIHRFTTNRWNFLKGNASLSGSNGDLDYTLALVNDGLRLGAKGPTLIHDGTGELTERRYTIYHFNDDKPKLTAELSYDGIPGVLANLSLSYARIYSDTHDPDTRELIGGVDQAQDRHLRQRGYEYEIAGDVEFGLGPGRLKLIGLESYKRRDNVETAIISFADLSAPTGKRYLSDSNKGERIARAEYSWPMLGSEWQFAGEAAFNRIDNVAALFTLDPSGDFIEVEFPGGTGGVREDRYETILSNIGQLSGKLSYQLTAGAEFSTISQTGADAISRSFVRPKGSASLAWSPKDGWDLSFELARRVGQLDFADFLASASLGDEYQNSANARLVPQQSWEVQVEASHEFGGWGTATLKLFHHRISDIVDIVALPDGTAAKGNIDSARVTGGSVDATIDLDALGLDGARLDLQAKLEHSRVLDPIDGIVRSIGRREKHYFDVAFRHDIPQTDFAWGIHGYSRRNGFYFRVDEEGREYFGPTFVEAYVEHKDLMGLTVRLQLENLASPARRLARTVYDGIRGSDPVFYTEVRNQPFGPKLVLRISGSF